MATVYLAHDLKHGRAVALKVLRPELTNTARLDHPHILTLIDSGEADGFFYYVVAYVRGESWRGKLERMQPMMVRVTPRETWGVRPRTVTWATCQLTRCGKAVLGDCGAWTTRCRARFLPARFAV